MFSSNSLFLIMGLAGVDCLAATAGPVVYFVHSRLQGIEGDHLRRVLQGRLQVGERVLGHGDSPCLD